MVKNCAEFVETGRVITVAAVFFGEVLQVCSLISSSADGRHVFASRAGELVLVARLLLTGLVSFSTLTFVFHPRCFILVYLSGATTCD